VCWTFGRRVGYGELAARQRTFQSGAFLPSGTDSIVGERRAEEMAIKFPDVDVKTIDVAPTIAHLPRANLHHEVYDIHAGIMEPDNSFDIVHARHTINMVRGSFLSRPCSST
jgi:hypothetical protein